jgi:hypothetical protein
MEASTSVVSVLVIDCTTMGASPPTMMSPTITPTDFLLEINTLNLLL